MLNSKHNGYDVWPDSVTAVGQLSHFVFVPIIEALRHFMQDFLLPEDTLQKKKRMYDISVTSMPKCWTWSSAILSGGSKRHACQAQKRAKKRCVEWLLPTLTLPCLFAHISWKRVPDWLTDWLLVPHCRKERSWSQRDTEDFGVIPHQFWMLSHNDAFHRLVLLALVEDKYYSTWKVASPCSQLTRAISGTTGPPIL